MKKAILLAAVLTFALHISAFAEAGVNLPTRGEPVDRSGTITSGGTSQVLAPALRSRVYIEVDNISDEPMYINFGAAATIDGNSFKILPGAFWLNAGYFSPITTITIVSATTGKKFVAKEY